MTKNSVGKYYYLDLTNFSEAPWALRMELSFMSPAWFPHGLYNPKETPQALEVAPWS